MMIKDNEEKNKEKNLKKEFYLKIIKIIID